MTVTTHLSHTKHASRYLRDDIIIRIRIMIIYFSFISVPV